MIMSNEQINSLRKFAQIIIEGSVFNGGDWSGGSVQEMAEEFGLIVTEPYNSVIHGETEGEFEEGDSIYVLSDFMCDNEDHLNQ